MAAVAAALWRAFYLVRLSPTPLARLLEMDSRIYWEWSGLLVRDGLMGTHQFFMAPLYPYALALVRLVTGESVGAIQVLQSVLSSIAIGLLASLVARLHGVRWGLALGLLLAGYGPWIFMDGQILMEPLLLALQVLLLWVLVARRNRQASLRSVALLGLLIGFMAQARATHLLLAAPVGFWEVRRPSERSGLLRTLVFVAALALTAAPAALRSYAIGREVIPFTYGTGYNLYVGNGAAATGGFVNLPEADSEPVDRSFEGGAIGDGRNLLRARLGETPSPARSSELWLALARSEIAADPLRWFRLLGRKSLLLVNHEEPSQIQSPQAYATLAGPLGWPLLGGFGVLGVLGLLGLLVAARGPGLSRVLAGMWLALALGTVAVFITDRYRIHLVPTSAMLAPLSLDLFVRTFAGREWTKLLRGLPAFLATGALVFWPNVGSSPAKVRYDVATTLASAYLQAQRPADAERELSAAIAIDRDNVLPGESTASGRSARAGVHRLRAFVAMEDGDWTTAVADFERASEIDQGDAAYALYRAIAVAADGDARTASALLRARGITPERARDELLLRIKDSETRANRRAMGGYLRALEALVPH